MLTQFPSKRVKYPPSRRKTWFKIQNMKKLAIAKREKRVEISEYSKVSLKPLVNVARFFGIMPFSFVEQGVVNGFEFSNKFGLYSICFALFMPFFTFSGIITDIITGSSQDMKDLFVRSVSLADFSTIVITYVTAIVTIVVQRNKFLCIINHLTQIDKILDMKHPEEARQYSILILVLLYCSSSFIAALHNYMTLVTIPSLGVQSPAPFFIPYLSSYFILITIVATYIILLDGFKRRFSALLLRLSTENIVFITNPPKTTTNNFNIDSYIEAYSQSTTQTKERLNEEKINSIGSKFIIHDLFKDQPDEDEMKIRKAILSPDYVAALLKVYDNLFLVLTCFNDIFGLAMTFLIFNSTMNILVCAYYLVKELIEQDPAMFCIMEIFWCCFHALRLLMIIESADSINKQLCQLRPRVVKLLELNLDKATRHQLLIFSTYLMQTATSPFNPCGLFFISRKILLNIFGTTLSYLVILISFHSVADPESTMIGSAILDQHILDYEFFTKNVTNITET